MSAYFENLHKVVATSATEVYNNDTGITRVVWLKNPNANSDTFYLGTSTVTAPATADGTDGFELAPGEAVPVTFAEGGTLYAIANTLGTEKIHILSSIDV